LQGKTVVVTAGGTQEPIDPVRTISNRSSGKQGFALAQAAIDLGAQVTLIAAPTYLPTPVGATRVDVNTAEEMLHAVEQAVRNADVLLMAAAVADFRPVSAADHKIKKDTGIPQIFLEKTSDILSAIASQRSATGYPRIMVGFAAESEDLLENARSKMRSKHLDMIVANDISATDSGFAVDDNRVTLLDSMGGVEELPLQSKAEVAATIMQRVVVGLSNIG
jgi:phosphopantothenoylcysteine decarboxylase / phosphopantothenate---cysteine ligase